MKKTFSFFAIVMACLLTFSLSSCKKDPVTPPTNQNPGGEEPQVETLKLDNTSWTSALQSTMTMQGVTMNLDLDASLDFQDATNGEFYMLVNIEVPAMPSASQHQDITYLFTYTVKDNIISITYEYEDPETHETETYTDELTYNPEEQTITMYFNDAEMEEMFGTDKLVFTKVQE